MKFLVAILAGVLFSACVKNGKCDCVMPYQIYYLKAKVVQVRDVSCNLPGLDFSEDSVRIRQVTNINNLLYSVIRLPAGYIAQDKKLYVSVIKLTPEEEFPCNTLGIPFPHLKIVDAKDRD